MFSRTIVGRSGGGAGGLWTWLIWPLSPKQCCGQSVVPRDPRPTFHMAVLGGGAPKEGIQVKGGSQASKGSKTGWNVPKLCCCWNKQGSSPPMHFPDFITFKEFLESRHVNLHSKQQCPHFASREPLTLREAESHTQDHTADHWGGSVDVL